MLNGIEAMKDKSGVVTVKSQPEDSRVLISVSHTGAKLPAEKPGKIFDAFYWTKPLGSGVGPATIGRTIESHSGRLSAAPGDGRGASFHFYLPIVIEPLQVPASGA